MAGNKSEWKLVNITFGIVELPMLKTKGERRKATSIANLPLESPCNKIRNLVRLLREEYINLGENGHWMENCK